MSNFRTERATMVGARQAVNHKVRGVQSHWARHETDADIAKCFDQIDQAALLGRLPVFTITIRRWLKVSPSGNASERVRVSRMSASMTCDTLSRRRRLARVRGNGGAERFFRTLKEQVVHGRIYQTIDDVRVAARKFFELSHAEWLIIEKNGLRSPRQTRFTWKQANMKHAAQLKLVSEVPGAVPAQCL